MGSVAAQEQDAAAGSRRERLNEVPLRVETVDLEDVVGHRLDVRGGIVDRVEHLVVEVTVHDLVDAVVQRGGEQHPLAAVGCLVEDARDDGQEAQVGHVVGLVEHGDLHSVEGDESLLHQVLEAPWAGDDDVDTGLECGDLSLLRDAAEDRGDLEAVRRRERLHGRGDLGGQFAGRGEHEAARPAGGRAAAIRESRDHRKGERERLAAAGLAAAEDVAPAEGVGEGVLLDGEGARDAAPGERVDER